MVEFGAAQIVIGNHEFNAISFATANPEISGEFMRPQSDKNRSQHRAFIDQVQIHAGLYGLGTSGSPVRSPDPLRDASVPVQHLHSRPLPPLRCSERHRRRGALLPYARPQRAADTALSWPITWW